MSTGAPQSVITKLPADAKDPTLCGSGQGPFSGLVRSGAGSWGAARESPPTVEYALQVVNLPR